ncbi:maleylpyruvate isomerase family mycothiol-dependent enzyme [Thermocrispum municipale]|uniref:maleylpyruvate isomerase family mycothiol-dependent enzyme n=1 Tax=Thermocrispum municipale TaxID=37926 RepID=UPI00042A8446|nr:maleylpyruvate isomerase family mycothiol-dependent enzyme [Thermocrispum municipale]
MSTSELTAARAALRERQGSGARYDSPAAPARELEWARRGTAYFARVLSQTSDAELRRPSALPGWSKAALVAHVGYNARALTRLCEWARTGVRNPMYSSPEARMAEIRRGESLPPRALRHLAHHAAIHLDVEWRDLDAAAWDASVVTAQGRTVPARETVWMRTREVWVHAADLGGSFRRFPREVLDALLKDVVAVWERRDCVPDLQVHLVDQDRTVTIGDGGPTVAGSTADVVRWMTGRGAVRLDTDGFDLSGLPSWL